jgi:hypothetical protein
MHEPDRTGVCRGVDPQDRASRHRRCEIACRRRNRRCSVRCHPGAGDRVAQPHLISGVAGRSYAPLVEGVR